MDDYRIAVGFFDHPKTVMLKRRLGNDGVVSFIRLWEFCAKNTAHTNGSLGGMTDEAIAIAGHWDGDPTDFCDALRGVGYLDGKPKQHKIHEWRKHQPWVFGHRARSAQAKKAAYVKHHKKKKKTGLPKPQNSSADPQDQLCPVSTPTTVSVSTPNTNATGSCGDLSSLDGETELTAEQVEQHGFSKYGSVGANIGRVAVLAPFRVWEVKAALDGWAKKWGGFCDSIEQIREDNGKDKPKAKDEKKEPIPHYWLPADREIDYGPEPPRIGFEDETDPEF